MAQTPDPAPLPHRMNVLSIYAAHSDLPAVRQISAGISQVLTPTTPEGNEIYNEYLDVLRFPPPANVDAVARGMAEKYRDVAMDLIFASGVDAVKFLLAHHDQIAPGVPVVFGGFGADELVGLTLPPDFSGVLSDFDLKPTLDLARTLQPSATQIVILTGSSPFDQNRAQAARSALGERYSGLPVRYLTGKSVAGFAEAAAKLDPDAILVILTVFLDAAGNRHVPSQAALEIAAASAAPAYTVFDTYVGIGVVGGVFQPFDTVGASMAQKGLRVLARDATQTQIDNVPSQTIVDWRALTRWGLRTALLPPGTDLRFHEPSLWERYKVPIILAGLVLLLQAATIAALILQSLRRSRTEAQLALERRQLYLLSRASLLGELSGALAHELTQPLTAILANAAAGSNLLQRDPPDNLQAAEIFDDITRSARLGSDIITRLRRLFLKGDAALVPVDLNQVVTETVKLTASELAARQIRVDLRLATGEVPLMGDFAQLQQVVLNLLLNAAEAMANLPAPARVVTVETTTAPDRRRQLSVTDCGPGLSPEIRDHAFKPFASLKANGLGFGLSISRSIAAAHGGTLDFDDRMQQGARVTLTLPAL